eukprot:15180-Heterococcus_DN1.PRE.1
MKSRNNTHVTGTAQQYHTICATKATKTEARSRCSCAVAPVLLLMHACTDERLIHSATRAHRTT